MADLGERAPFGSLPVATLSWTQATDWPTQEWKHHLRSSLHPALFALAFAGVDKITAILSCSSQFRASVLAVVPKLVQACFAVLGDYYSWKLAEKVYGPGSRSAWSAVCSRHLCRRYGGVLADHPNSYV